MAEKVPLIDAILSRCVWESMYRVVVKVMVVSATKVLACGRARLSRR